MAEIVKSGEISQFEKFTLGNFDADFGKVGFSYSKRVVLGVKVGN